MDSSKTPEENNKVIAEFMQLRCDIVNGEETWINPVLAQRTNQLNYNGSWGWLMQVVEKIGEYHYPNYFDNCPESHEKEPYEDCAYLRTFGMRDKEGNYLVRFNASQLFSEPTLIEATYLAVVDFIQWYNNTQNKPL